LEEEENDALLHSPSSPSQSLLALSGADVDDSLLPALDWDMGDLPDPSSSSSSTTTEASSSLGTLLLFDEEEPSILRSPSPELDLTNVFDVDISNYSCPRCGDKQDAQKTPCQCTDELTGLTRLRRQYLKAEREARNVEGKMKAQAANARISGGGYGYGWGVRKESEYGDRARYEARKWVKREKERGREVGDLVRLGMMKRGVCLASRRAGDGESGEGKGKEESGEQEGKKKKKKKPELKNVDLVAKTLLRKDNTA
jgi:hypothetical protein